MMEEIKKNFREAQSVLEAFISEEKNWQAIENAGKMLVEAIQ